jgi:hypothetical protein
MKILFVMRSTVYVRNFESTLRMLAGRGHEVEVLADVHHLDPTNLVGRLAEEYPGIRHSAPPTRPVDGWVLLGDELRRGVDYLRYLRPEYEGATKLRERAHSNAPPFVLAVTERPAGRAAVGRAALDRALRLADRALPIDPVVADFVRARNPDLLIVTPLVEPGAPQSHYLRAARALGIPTALCVYSWDNLTNKGLIQDPLDLVTVWNEPMKQEAMRLHGVPADRVVVTGAPAYDHWFEWKPRDSRADFCRRVGLPADRPYLLYLCSSKFIAPQEVSFVRQWIAQLRAASATLAATGVLIRPHPQNTKSWKAADFSDLEAVTIWPREGGNPVDGDSRASYYDSIFHSCGVVGINTSAQIESAIVGRSVYTLLAPEFRDTQEGTLHFHHLREVNGGMLHVASTFAEHAAELEAAVQSGGADDGRCRRFVEVFVRPFGIDRPATPRLVDALEAVGARRRRPHKRAPWYAGIVRARLRHRAGALAEAEQRRVQEEARRRQRQRAKAERAAAVEREAR